MESWACGTPVLTSNNSSLVEVGGDGAVLVNPNDVSDITRGLVQALSETDLEELLQKGKEAFRTFPVESCSRRHPEIHPGCL